MAINPENPSPEGADTTDSAVEAASRLLRFVQDSHQPIPPEVTPTFEIPTGTQEHLITPTPEEAEAAEQQRLAKLRAETEPKEKAKQKHPSQRASGRTYPGLRPSVRAKPGYDKEKGQSAKPPQQLFE